MSYDPFEGAGLYLYNPEVGIDQTEFVTKFKNAGGTWIGFLIQEGKTEIINPKNVELMIICRNLGIKVIGSSWLSDDPIEEAKISRTLGVEHKVDGWIGNGEKPLGYTQPWGPCAPCFNYSSQWMSVWGMMRPTMFSSYAIFANHDIDYKPWIMSGAFAGPQAYNNEFGDGFSPGPALDGAYDVRQPWNGYRGFETQRIAPTAGIYQYSGMAAPDIEQWLADLKYGRRTYPGKGFSFWPGELFNGLPNSWTILENAIKVHGLARYPGDAADQVEPFLTAAQLPYTGPYYGPTTNKPKRKGKTAKALKMTMHILGFGNFPTPDEYYNLALEMAMRRFQSAKGITVTSGNYGLGTWELIRKTRLPNGKIAIPETARQLIRSEATGG